MIFLWKLTIVSVLSASCISAQHFHDLNNTSEEGFAALNDGGEKFDPYGNGSDSNGDELGINVNINEESEKEFTPYVEKFYNETADPNAEKMGRPYYGILQANDQWEGRIEKGSEKQFCIHYWPELTPLPFKWNIVSHYFYL